MSKSNHKVCASKRLCGLRFNLQLAIKGLLRFVSSYTSIMKLLLLAASLISLVATGTESISKYNQKYSFQYSFLSSPSACRTSGASKNRYWWGQFVTIDRNARILKFLEVPFDEFFVEFFVF